MMMEDDLLLIITTEEITRGQMEYVFDDKHSGIRLNRLTMSMWRSQSSFNLHRRPPTTSDTGDEVESVMYLRVARYCLTCNYYWLYQEDFWGSTTISVVCVMKGRDYYDHIRPFSSSQGRMRTSVATLNIIAVALSFVVIIYISIVDGL